MHVHLAPHHEGDALNEQIIRGEFDERRLPSGAIEYVSKDFPPLPEEDHRVTIERLGVLLGGQYNHRPESSSPFPLSEGTHSPNAGRI